MQETANKQKRITLKTVHEMLDGMSVELAEKVHQMAFNEGNIAKLDAHQIY